MRNKLLTFLREQNMVQPGDRVICAVSGGADSMALLWCMYLLKDKLGITLEAAHFNHHLRGPESDRDEAFVKEFCISHGIPCHVGSAEVKAGEKGLEAAARTARYAFLQSLPGKIATAHTADDNAETLIMHLIRGTGLKGLGGITPVRENLIRPMLTVTRQDVLAFLEEERIPCVIDSSNETDTFLRNRIRHHVIPLLKQENPSLAENLSATALRLRQDDEMLEELAMPTTDVTALRQMPPALRSRSLGNLLISFGVKEPERTHIAQLERIVLSENPSAWGMFPGEIPVGREYDRLVKLEDIPPLGEYPLSCPGETVIPELNMKVTCMPPGENPRGCPGRTTGSLILRSRRAGDKLLLTGGTRTLKKLFIDRKVPSRERERIPVIADDAGVVLVAGIGPSQDRLEAPNWEILMETM